MSGVSKIDTTRIMDEFYGDAVQLHDKMETFKVGNTIQHEQWYLV